MSAFRLDDPQWQRHFVLGVGWRIFVRLMIEYAKSEGLSRIDGQIRQENSVMLKMCRELGFKIKTDAEDGGVRDVTLELP